MLSEYFRERHNALGLNCLREFQSLSAVFKRNRWLRQHFLYQRREGDRISPNGALQNKRSGAAATWVGKVLEAMTSIRGRANTTSAFVFSGFIQWPYFKYIVVVFHRVAEEPLIIYSVRRWVFNHVITPFMGHSASGAGNE